MTLVPGRECGDCTACCVVFGIDQPEDIQKAAGIPCRHCTGIGCAIYETRPRLCRTFYCRWRTDETLGEHWRPDKSGVLAFVETEHIPASFEQSTGIGLLLVADPLVAIRQRGFQDFVAQNVLRSIPVILMLPGPRGYAGSALLLNTDDMLEAIARGTAQAALEGVLEMLRAWRCDRTDVITPTGHDASNVLAGSQRDATHRDALGQPTFPACRA